MHQFGFDVLIYVYQKEVSGEVKEQIIWPTQNVMEAVGRKDIFNARKEAGRTNEFTNSCESATLSRMKGEGGVEGRGGGKLEMAKNEGLVKSSRWMVSQQRTGLISYCMLKEIMK